MPRPTSFDVLVDLAEAMWAPVFRELSQEDFARLNTVPYDEQLYQARDVAASETVSTFLVRKPDAIESPDIKWISAEQVDQLHDRLIQAFGGAPGVKHPGHVAGFIDRAKHSVVHGHDILPTVFDKAAHILRSILTGHPYTDGQKRTGLAAAFVFLGLNGYALWARNQMDEVHFAIEVARGEHEVDRVSEWLEKRVGPLRMGAGNADIVRTLGGMRKQPRCFDCSRFVRVLGTKAVCENCNIVFELTARAVGFAEGLDGRHIEARIGLHKIGSGNAAVKRVLAEPYIDWPAVFKRYPHCPRCSKDWAGLKSGQIVGRYLIRLDQGGLSTAANIRLLCRPCFDVENEEAGGKGATKKSRKKDRR